MGRAGLAPLWFTDHDGLTVDLILDTPVFGSGYWKLNVNILEEREFKDFFYRAFKGWVSFVREILTEHLQVYIVHDQIHASTSKVTMYCLFI